MLCHLVDREIGIDVLIGRALAGEVVHASQEERAQVGHAEVGAESAGWDLERIREELVAARERLRQTFLRMQEEDLDLPIRWQEWPARTIRTTIPYLLEHEDSHMDELRDAVEREHRLVP